MKRVENIVFFFWLLVVSLCSCTNNNRITEIYEDEQAELKIGAVMNFSEHDFTFKEGDTIGVLITDETRYGVINNDFDMYGNIPYVYKNGKWVTDRKVMLPNEDVFVCAYYPYYHNGQNNGTNIPFNFSDQENMFWGYNRYYAPVNSELNIAHISMERVCPVLRFFFKKENYTGNGKINRIGAANNNRAKIIVYNNAFVLPTSKRMVEQFSGNNFVANLELDSRNFIIGNEFGDEQTGHYIDYIVPPLNNPLNENEVYLYVTIDDIGYQYMCPAGTMWESNTIYPYKVTLNPAYPHTQTSSETKTEPLERKYKIEVTH